MGENPPIFMFSSTLFASFFKNEISLLWNTTKQQVVNQQVVIALKNYPSSMKKQIHILTTHLPPLNKEKKPMGKKTAKMILILNMPFNQ